MTFDRFTVVVLVLRADAPHLDEVAAAALQDAHMAHLAELHDQGVVLASGPLGDETYRGLSIFAVGVDEARTVAEANPGVQAGRYAVVVLPWMVPGGAMAFRHTRFPRSMTEVNQEPVEKA